MNTILAYATNTVVLCVACLVAGVVFSQKIKDWLTGTSSEFRTAMNGVETKAKTDVQAAVADVFAKLTPSPVKAQSPVVPVPPQVAAPVAPAPAAEPPKA